MAKLAITNGSTSNILRVKLTQSSTGTTPGAALLGLDHTSAGLIIGTIADLEATTTRYRASSSELETISTLGTYAAPTSGKCRFKEVDQTNHPGLYEIHLADARFAVANAKALIVSLSGATDLFDCDLEIDQGGSAGGDSAGVTTLLSRLTSTRAGYLDNLSAGAVALQGTLSTVATDVGTILARIGAFTGTGVNTILGFLKAAMSKAASTPSDVGGTFDATTDSLEAIKDGGVAGLDAAGVRAAVGLASANLDTQLGGIQTTANTIDGRFTTNRGEPAQGAPGVSVTVLQKVDFLYKLARNKITQDSTTLKVYADNGTTVDHKAPVSDTGTYTRGEIVSGP